MFDRRITRRFFNASSERVTVDITSLECVPHSHGAMRTLLELLQNLVSNPDMLHCEGRFAESIEIKHDGKKWVIRAEAVVPRPTFS